MKNIDIFLDMDGTLNVFELGTPLEEVQKPGYMKYRRPIENMIQLGKQLSEIPGITVWIASAVLDAPHAIPDKDYWNDRFVPFIPKDRRLYIQCGSSKADAIKKASNSNNIRILIDDKTSNLQDCKNVCIGIKVLNGINDSHKSWTGYRIDNSKTPEELTKELTSIIQRA